MNNKDLNSVKKIERLEYWTGGPMNGPWESHPTSGDIVDKVNEIVDVLNSNYVKIPDTGIEDLSDGFHTFKQLYYQRMMLFATIVRQNRRRAWKSLRHEDGELCFGGGWFIVGIDTPEGSYTYHYEDSYYSLFDCEELERAKHWDGHTEKDVTRLLSLPTEQPEDWMSKNKDRILQAGMEGKEVEFRIGGRLFAIREKAQ